MTTTDTDLDNATTGVGARRRLKRGGGGSRSHPARSRRALLAFAAIAVGLGVGRLVTVDTSAPAPAQAPAIAKGDPQSIPQLEASTRRDPTNVQTWQNLGVAYLHRAIATYDPDDYSLAKRAFDRADELLPGQDTTTLGRGALALSLHQFAQALVFGTRVHDHDPEQPDALAVIVDADVELGHYDAAAAALQELLDRRPGLPAYSRTSYLRELHGDLPGALEAMREAEVAGATSRFDVATVTAFQGDVDVMAGDFDAAGERYAHALALQADLVNAVVGQARVRAVMGDVAGAITQLEQLTARVPLPTAVILLGDLQAQAGRTADAQHTYALVHAIDQLQQAAGQVTDLEMSVFESDHGNPSRGLELARRAYAERGDNVYVDDALAWALHRTGDDTAARPMMALALRLDTADPMLHFHAAVIDDASGDGAAARAEITRVVSTNPWFSFALHPQVVALAKRLGVEPVTHA
ncbi:MAG TPA: tetratricopeptide repeat protein [Acidimicrobiia bacterium]|jgi:tetratricopeptide (TPR) repeat protein